MTPGKRTLTEAATADHNPSAKPHYFNPLGGAAAPAAGNQTKGPPNASPSQAATDGKDQTPAPILPVGHGSREIQIEFGDGSVTGGITATLEYGKSGLPLGEGQIKALENTSTIKLNGLVAKLETTILNGEIEGELFEGLKISFEADAIKAGADSDGETDIDLMTLTVKLAGDASHLLGTGPAVTLKVDGKLSVALGGKLAARLSSLVISQLEQKMIAKEMEELGSFVDDHARKVKDLHAKADLLEATGSRDAAAKLREEAFEHRQKISTANQQLKGHADKLKEAKARADKVLDKLDGKIVKQAAKAMQKKAIKFIATKLMKLVPILNVVSTIVDAIELVGVIKNLIDGDFGGSGGEGGGKQGSNGAGGDDAGGARAQEGKATTKESGKGATDVTPQETKDAAELARRQLPPAARALLDALQITGTSGPQLTPDEIKMVGLLVPEDLTSDELTEVLALLRDTQRGKAGTGKQVIQAIDQAVRDLRNRDRTVTVNGQKRQDLAGGAPDEKPLERRRGGGGGGPITSPSQVEEPITPLEIIRSGDAAILERWIRAVDDELVWSGEGLQWKNAHEGARVDAKAVLVVVEKNFQIFNEATWMLCVTFVLSINSERRRVMHHFFVPRGGDDTSIGGVELEPITVISVP